jgi:hypothetical protein
MGHERRSRRFVATQLTRSARWFALSLGNAGEVTVRDRAVNSYGVHINEYKEQTLANLR